MSIFGWGGVGRKRWLEVTRAGIQDAIDADGKDVTWALVGAALLYGANGINNGKDMEIWSKAWARTRYDGHGGVRKNPRKKY